MPKSAGKKSKRSAKEDIYTKPLTALQRCYFQEFTKAAVDPIESVRRGIRNCLEAERGPVAFEKLIIEPPKPNAKPKVPKEGEEIILSDKPPPMVGVAASACLPPLCAAIRAQNFTMIKEIHFWEFPIALWVATKFADLLSAMKYPITVLEFVDCDLCPESINRIAMALPDCELLKIISFDYNMLDTKGLLKLLRSLQRCIKLVEISLCYCGLNSSAGIPLGRYAATTAIRNIFLDGNDLGMAGVNDIFCEVMIEFDKIDAQLAAAAAEEAAAAAAARETLDIDGSVINAGGVDPGTIVTPVKTPDEPPKTKKKKKKRSRSKKKKKVDEVIPPGPWLRKLHLADTFGGFSQIEHYRITEKSSPECQVSSQALDCIKLAKLIGKFILKCKELEELDFYNNWLGNGGAAVLLDALQKREAAEDPRIGMRLNRGIEGALLKKIFKIASGVKKKKKRRKSAKKK